MFEPHRHVCLASLSAEIARHVVTVYGFSKGHALAGLRVGCAICTDPAWRRRIVEASGAEQTVFGASTLSQRAAVAALQEGGPWQQAFLRHLRTQRELAVQRPRGPWCRARPAGSAPVPHATCGCASPRRAAS